MKRLSFLFVFLFSVALVHSQKVFFVFLQSESNQPFFVGLKEKAISSNPAGYLIIPGLGEANHLIRVGFPGGQWPEQNFQVNINGRDRGFLIKNFGEKGWGLFDLQTLNVIMAEAPKDHGVKTEIRQVSYFTEILSRATNDPSLKERVVLVKADVKPVEAEQAVVKENLPPVISTQTPAQPEEKVATVVILSNGESKSGKTDSNIAKANPEPLKDTVAQTAEVAAKSDTLKLAVKDNTPTPAVIENKPVDIPTAKPVVTPEGIATAIVTEEKVDNEKKEAVYERSVVTRRSESSTTEGFGAVYIDKYADGHSDTIRIIIPNPKTAYVKPVETEKPKAQGQDPVNEAKTAEVKDTEAAKAVNKSKFESCKSVAAESDFLQLRKKMAAQKVDQEKIRESRKAFKTKCYTTAQIQNLGNLFANEAGKFQFYEGAYPFVSDRDGYGVLVNEFKDPYFVYRFKTLVNN